MIDEIEQTDQSAEEPVTAAKSSRGRFIKQLGRTLAIGLGTAALVASTARADHQAGHACPSSQCPPDSQCWCNCTGIGESYCFPCSGCRSCPC